MNNWNTEAGHKKNLHVSANDGWLFRDIFGTLLDLFDQIYKDVVKEIFSNNARDFFGTSKDSVSEFKAMAKQRNDTFVHCMEKAVEIKANRRYGIHLQMNKEGKPQLTFGRLEDYHLIMPKANSYKLETSKNNAVLLVEKTP